MITEIPGLSELLSYGYVYISIKVVVKFLNSGNLVMNGNGRMP